MNGKKTIDKVRKQRQAWRTLRGIEMLIPKQNMPELETKRGGQHGKLSRSLQKSEEIQTYFGSMSELGHRRDGLSELEMDNGQLTPDRQKAAVVNKHYSSLLTKGH